MCVPLLAGAHVAGYVCVCLLMCMQLCIQCGVCVCVCMNVYAHVVRQCVCFHLLRLYGQTCIRPYIRSQSTRWLKQNSVPKQPSSASRWGSPHLWTRHSFPTCVHLKGPHLSFKPPCLSLCLSLLCFFKSKRFVGEETYVVWRKHIHNCRVRMSASYCVLPDGGKGFNRPPLS